MNKEDIKKFLPHREPMLLIDEAVVDENNIAHCKYTIKEDEFFTRGPELRHTCKGRYSWSSYTVRRT